MWVLRASACRFSAFSPSRGEKVLKTARSRGRSSIEEFAAAYGFNPMILVANPTISHGRSGDPESQMPTRVRAKALAIALCEFLQSCGDVGLASRLGILQRAAPKRRESGRKY